MNGNFMKTVKKASVGLIIGSALTIGATSIHAADMSRGANNFYTSAKVNSEKVKFPNSFGMELTGVLFTPRNMEKDKKYSAVVIGHPFAAVKEQAANLYATKLAEAGIPALTFDQVFWGESAGQPRGGVLPDLYAESFSAGVDYLGTRPFIDREKIGVLGICGSGGFAIAATKIDPRIKALATVSMYDMGEYFRSGINNDRPKERRDADLRKAAADRYKAFETGKPVYGPGQNDPVFQEAAESKDFYQTERGMVPSNDRRSAPATYVKFMNFYPFIDMDSISPRPILFVAGEIAPSRCYTETAYKMAAEPKELVIVKDANRLDLYDRVDIIPWTKIFSFFDQNLNNGQ